MDNRILICELELGYAPLSAYAFYKMISDKSFHKNVSDNHLYIIAQRSEPTFNNFSPSSNSQIRFEIGQGGASETISCVLPFFQEHITMDRSKGIDLRLHNRKNTAERKNIPPYNGTQGISFQEVDSETNKRRHLIWFSPEKLLQNYWKGYISVDIVGDYRQLLKYKVLYVGKSTEQNICKRLSNHSAFQEILASEEPLTCGNIPSDEIVILLFRVRDCNIITQWSPDSSDEDMGDFLLNYSLPSDKLISLDAEKALIKHLTPGYNRVVYKSYPGDSVLINQDFSNSILYSFSDPITLVYDGGQIVGDEWHTHRSCIVVRQESD